MTGLLVRPGHEHLPGYVEALERGWSPNTTRDVSGQELAQIRAGPDAFLAAMDDPQALAGDVELPDGTMVKRLPSLKRFIWDHGFCGIINLRWQDGTTELPPHVLGHIGYSIVPWQRGKGLATRALAEILPEARALGLDFVELTADVTNAASTRVIEKCGGIAQRRFAAPPGYEQHDVMLYRIALA